MTTCYKLTMQDLTTYNGFKWEVGETYKTSGNGKLCSDAFIHAYTSPLLAVLLNPLHAKIKNPKLFLAEGYGFFLSDCGLKVGYSEMTLVEEIVLPIFTPEQRVAFAILCALKICKEQSFVYWAENWLNGKDRGDAAALAAGAAAAAAEAVVWATGAAALVARTAAGVVGASAGATWAAAEAAAWAAEIDLHALAEKALLQY